MCWDQCLCHGRFRNCSARNGYDEVLSLLQATCTLCHRGALWQSGPRRKKRKQRTPHLGYGLLNACSSLQRRQQRHATSASKQIAEDAYRDWVGGECARSWPLSLLHPPHRTQVKIIGRPVSAFQQSIYSQWVRINDNLCKSAPPHIAMTTSNGECFVGYTGGRPSTRLH